MNYVRIYVTKEDTQRLMLAGRQEKMLLEEPYISLGTHIVVIIVRELWTNMGLAV